MGQAVKEHELPPLPPGFSEVIDTGAEQTRTLESKSNTDDLPPLPPGFSEVIDTGSTDTGSKLTSRGASGSWGQPHEPGIIAGLKRGFQNIIGIPGAIIEGSPLTDITRGQEALKGGKASSEEYVRQSNERFMSGLQRVNAHPVLGAAAGEFVEEIPKDPGGMLAEAATTVGTMAALGKGIPWLAHYKSEHPILPALRRSLFRSPETLITKSLTPSDNFFQKHVQAGLRELKTGEAEIAASPNPAATSREVLKTRRSMYSEKIDDIVRPQASIVYPGSGLEVAKAKIAEIPNQIKIHDPAQYERLATKALQEGERDLTLGELNTLRSELSATQSIYYGKDLSGQLTMDASKRAMDIAEGNAVRRLFYQGLDTYGLGGGKAAAEINSRIGSAIHMDDALLPAVNKVIEQKTALGHKGLQVVGRIASPTQWGRPSRPIEKDLKLALSRQKKLPDPINFNLEPRIKGTAGKPQSLPFAPGPLGSTDIGPKGEYLTPEAEYLSDLHRREIWSSSAPMKPYKGQIEMFPGGPPNMFPLTERFPSSKPIDPMVSKMQESGSIGTRGAQRLLNPTAEDYLRRKGLKPDKK